MPENTPAQRSPLSSEGRAFFSQLEDAHEQLRSDTAAFASALVQQLDTLGAQLPPLRGRAMLASLNEDERSTKADVDMLDRRYRRGEDLLRMLRQNAVELAQLMQTAAREAVDACARAAERPES